MGGRWRDALVKCAHVAVRRRHGSDVAGLGVVMRKLAVGYGGRPAPEPAHGIRLSDEDTLEAVLLRSPAPREAQQWSGERISTALKNLRGEAA